MIVIDCLDDPDDTLKRKVCVSKFNVNIPCVCEVYVLGTMEITSTAYASGLSVYVGIKGRWLGHIKLARTFSHLK